MAVAVSGHTITNNSSTTATGVTLAVPAGASVGELLVAYVAPHTATLSAAPTGWTRLQGIASGTSSLCVFTRTYTAGDVNWAWSWGTTAVKYVAGIFSVGGWSGSGVLSASQGSGGVSGTTVTYPSVTTTVPSAIFRIEEHALNALGTSVPTGTTAVDRSNTTGSTTTTNQSMSAFKADSDQSVAGATNTTTSTIGSSLWSSATITVPVGAVTTYTATASIVPSAPTVSADGTFVAAGSGSGSTSGVVAATSDVAYMRSVSDPNTTTFGTVNTGDFVITDEPDNGAPNNHSVRLGNISTGNSTAVGIRFTGISIPDGATNIVATLSITPAAPYNPVTGHFITMWVSGQKTQNPVTFNGSTTATQGSGGTNSGDLKSAGRPRTTANVVFDITNWLSVATKTLDVSTIVQEIYSQAGTSNWLLSSAALVIILDTKNASGTATSGQTTTAEWQDMADFLATNAAPPSLSITYTPASGGTTYTATGAVTADPPVVAVAVTFASLSNATAALAPTVSVVAAGTFTPPAINAAADLAPSAPVVNSAATFRSNSAATAAIAAQVAIAAAGTSAPPTFNATVAIVPAQPSVAAVETFTSLSNATAAIAPTVSVAAAGTFTPPVFNATAALTPAVPVVSGVATFRSNSIATAALAVQVAIAAAGTSAPPVFNATAALAPASPVISGAATFVSLSNAVAAVTVQSAVASAGTFTAAGVTNATAAIAPTAPVTTGVLTFRSLGNASAALAPAPGPLAAALTFTSNSIAVAAIAPVAPTVAGAGTFTAQGSTAVAAVTPAAPVASGVVTFRSLSNLVAALSPQSALSAVITFHSLSNLTAALTGQSVIAAAGTFTGAGTVNLAAALSPAAPVANGAGTFRSLSNATAPLVVSQPGVISILTFTPPAYNATAALQPAPPIIFGAGTFVPLIILTGQVLAGAPSVSGELSFFLISNEGLAVLTEQLVWEAVMREELVWVATMEEATIWEAQMSERQIG